MFKMRVLLVLCMILAVTINVSARPNKEKDEAYDDEALLNDEDGGMYAEDDESANEEYDDDDDKEESSPINNWPKIKTAPLTIEANVGDNVNLPCVTENADVYSILWKKDSAMLYQDKIKVGVQHTNHYSRFENQTLHIENVQETDDGEYECSVSTSPDLLVVKHRLNVLVPPRIISATANKGSSEVKRGGMLELSCQAEGKPAPKVSWSKDGSRIKEDNQKFNGATVTIEDVSRDDAGVYVCMADNKVGTPVHQAVQVSVIHAPDMKIETIIVDDKEMHLLCKVHASPKAEIFWSKNNKKLRHNTDSIKLETKHHESEHIVKFLNFQQSDFGNYSCKATNQLGHLEKHIAVSGKPNTPKHEGQTFVGDNDVMSTWVVSSMSPITGIQLQYRKKGKENTWISERPKVEGLTGHTNTIQHVIKNLKSGVYEVRLRTENMYGWSDFAKPVSFEGKTDDISPYININEEPPMPIDDEKLAEPAVSSGPRTILSWTTVLSLITATICSRFI